MKTYTFKTVRNHVIMLKKPKMRNGVLVEYETTQTFTYYGIISPFKKDYMIMHTPDRKQAIVHTEKELDRVIDLLERNNIKDFRIFDAQTDEPINIALYEK